MAAIASATSGMRATSAFTNTMAVIMRSRYPCATTDRLVDRRQRATLVERDQRGAGLLDGVVDREVPRGTPDGAGPLALHVHQADTGLLQPAQDLLGLLGAGGGCRAGPTDHRVGGLTQLGDPHPGVGVGRDHPRRGQPPVT